MIKEIPILFSTPMVQAILEGRKSQTRRIMKPQPNFYVGQIIKPGDEQFFHPGENDGWRPSKVWKLMEPKGTNGGCLAINYKCPYGKVGDLLWVRETFTVLEPEHCSDMDNRFAYKASCCAESEEIRKEYVECGWPYTWKPSIHMPKSAARIWLQVESVRVERLQDISEEDAEKEGAAPRSHRCGGFGYYEAGGDIHECVCQSWESNAAVMGFKDLWCEINGSASWEANPWLWVISFKVLSTTGKPDLKILKK